MKMNIIDVINHFIMFLFIVKVSGSYDPCGQTRKAKLIVIELYSYLKNHPTFPFLYFILFYFDLDV